jgi:hypothetical protein
MTDLTVSATPQASGSDHGLTRQDVFSALGALGAVLTLVTAVLFYFGWRRSDVQAAEMSIDVSLFGFSSQDYVLRSISSLYLPLLVILCLGLAGLWLHSRMTRLLHANLLAADHRRTAAAIWTLRGAAVSAGLAGGCVLFAAAAGVQPPLPVVGRLARSLRNDQWVVPLVLILATTTAAYAWWVHRQLRPPDRVREAAPLWQATLIAALTAGTVMLGAFWLLEEYASAVGRGYAHRLAASVDRLPRTVVVSSRPLSVKAPGVHEERLGANGDPETRYRTTGLRLLARSGGKVLLVHDGWSPTDGTVIVLSDSDDLAWEFSR